MFVIMDYNEFRIKLKGLGLSKEKERLWLNLFDSIEHIIGFDNFYRDWLSFTRDFFRTKYVWDNFYVFNRFRIEDFARVYGLDFRDREYIDYCESMGWLLDDLFHHKGLL